MKLFGRSGGYYLFWTGFVYFWVGMYLALTHWYPVEYATLGFLLALSVPFWCPPVARYFNMDPVMLNLFRRKTAKNYLEEASDIYNLPKPNLVEPPVPKDEPATIFYRVGFTSDNRVSLQIGYSEITMNREGVDNLIKQLAVFRDQLPTKDCNNDNS